MMNDELKMARLQFIIHHSAFIISSLRYSVFIHRIVATPRASIVRCRPISSRARFYQAVEQRARFVEVAHLQGEQPTLFQKLGARYLDAGLVVRARGAVVELDGAREFLPLAVEVPASIVLPVPARP